MKPVHMIRQLDELKELFEHIAIYELVEKRKASPEEELDLKKLQKKSRKQ